MWRGTGPVSSEKLCCPYNTAIGRLSAEQEHRMFGHQIGLG